MSWHTQGNLISIACVAIPLFAIWAAEELAARRRKRDRR